MEPVVLTAVHWVYAIFVLLIFGSLAFKIDTGLIAIAGMFVLGWMILGSPIGGFQTIYNGMLAAGKVLLEIAFTIAIVVSLSKALEPMGAIGQMVKPFKKLMRTPTATWWIVGILMYIFSTFFWPSPASALLGSLFTPIAAAVGLPIMSLAMSMNLFGHGFMLGTDAVIQLAPKLTSEFAAVPITEVLNASWVLNTITAVVAIGIAWFFYVRKDIAKGVEGETYVHVEEVTDHKISTAARTAAIVVPIVFLFDIVALFAFGLKGGDATALLCGTVLMMMLIFCLWEYGNKDGIEKMTSALQDGFTFAMRCFAPVFLVAGLYLCGVGEFAKGIFGEAKALDIVKDLVAALNGVLPFSKVIVAPVHMLLSGLTGMDGSGFNDLPLMGMIARAWGETLPNMHTAGLFGVTGTGWLAALGQITMIWIGAGTVVPWGLIAVAAVTGVSPVELGRRNFIPVMAGLICATIACIFLM